MKKILVAIAVVALAAMAAPAFAAMNPFMDVPASHWAYDAVAQLAARGVVSGYPDGSYKGPNPATRYEIASMIARALAFVDFEKASKQDVELMRRLMVEFNDELLALGVRMDGLDERLGTIDKDLGGWKLSGEFDFRANFGTNDSDYFTDYKHDFVLDTYRIYLDKRINDTTTFTARFGTSDDRNTGGDMAMAWNYYYITTNLGYDMLLDVGNFGTSFEHDAGLVVDDGAYVGDFTENGFRLRKSWGMANVQLLVARRGDNNPDQWEVDVDDLSDWSAPWAWEAFWFGAHVDMTINEMFRGGVFAYYQKSEAEFLDSRLDVVGYVHFNFHPSITLSGAYYYQDIADAEETGKAWKVFLNIDQNLLQFSDLTLEYAQIDHWFYLDRNPYTKYGFDAHGGMVASDEDDFPIWIGPVWNVDGSTKVMGASANQQWGETAWSSWLRYYHFNFGIDDVPNASNFGAGVNYKFNPAVVFGLGFDYFSWGDDSDYVVRFQTVVNF